MREKVTALIRLYRPDVCFITFLTALAGPYLSRGSFDLRDIGIAAFLSLIPYNYVYAFNALTDRTEDAINHPERPLPAGRVTARAAQVYTALLLVLAVAGSLLLFRGAALFLALLIPLLGTLYSAGPFKFKDHPLVAAIITAWGLIHPFFITGDSAQVPLGLSFILLAAGVTIFKDIGDTAGDAAAGRRSIRAVLSPGALWGISLFLLAGSGAALAQGGRYFILPVPLLLAATLIHVRLRHPLEKSFPFLYTRLIRAALAALCVTGFMAIVDMLGGRA